MVELKNLHSLNIIPFITSAILTEIFSQEIFLLVHFFTWHSFMNK